jgi:hypothetical protein
MICRPNRASLESRFSPSVIRELPASKFEVHAFSIQSHALQPPNELDLTVSANDVMLCYISPPYALSQISRPTPRPDRTKRSECDERGDSSLQK